MAAFSSALAVFALGMGLVAALYGLNLAVALQRDPVRALPFLSGGQPVEHAWSRYHARWYVLSLMLLAFDMEMLFMYPWALIVREMGGGSVVEMFTFLGLLVAGVAYGAREGAFRWA